MDTSSFDNEINNPFVFTDIEPIRSNGATSDTYKVLIYGKWHFLKRPKKIFADNPLYLAAFQKEFEIGYTLDHPNIVRYISKSEDSESLYILTDYVDGFTLADFIKVYPNYFNDKENIDKLLKQLLSALSYLHERQILHLDLKPDNILITSINHDVKLIDFGFSYTDCFSSLAVGKTELYAAPEQLNRESLDQRTDIYGFGKLIEYILNQTSDTKLFSSYKTLINKCLSINKEDRLKSISEIQGYLLAKPKSKRGIFIFPLIALILFVVGFYIYQSFNKIDESLTIDSLPIDSISHTQDTAILSQNITATQPPTNKLSEKTTTEVVDSSKRFSRRVFNSEKYYGKYYNPEESLSDTISQKLFEQYIDECRKKLVKVYDVSGYQLYSRETRLKKMNDFTLIRDTYGQRIEWSPQRAAFNQIIAIEQRKIAASYYQKSLISELNEYIDKEIPSIETKEDAINSILRDIAPYWLAFYEKYSIIQTEEEYSDAEKIHWKAFIYSQKKNTEIYSQYRSLFSSEQEIYKLLKKDDLGDMGQHASDMFYVFKAYKNIKGYRWIDYVQ